MRTILFALFLVVLTVFAPAQPQQAAPFSEFTSVVSQSLNRAEAEPYRPCSDGPATHCVCREVTWLAGGELHSVTYQLCDVCDLRAVRDIMSTAHAMGMVLVSVKSVPCQ